MTEPELRLAVEVLRGYQHDKPCATAILRREGFTDVELALARWHLALRNSTRSSALT